MYGFDRSVEKEKLRFFSLLQESFPEIGIEQISIAAARIEQLIEIQVVNAFLTNITEVLGANDLRVHGHVFTHKKNVYEVNSAPDLKNPSDLCVSCIPRGIEHSQLGFFEYAVSLEPAGKFKRVIFCIPRNFSSVNAAFLIDLSNGLFSVGYRWLVDAIARAISKSVANTKESLYQFIRVMIPDDQFLDGFWFSALITETTGGKKDIVVLDDIAAKLSMKDAERSSQLIGQNAASIVTHMMTEIVDFQDSVLSVIDEKSKPFEIDLQEDEYYQYDASFNLSMRAVWGKSVSCFPIIVDGHFRLVAFFKPENSAILVPFLEHHRAHLQSIGNRQSQNIQEGLEIMKAVKQVSIDTHKIGEFLGGFTGSLVKSLSNT